MNIFSPTIKSHKVACLAALMLLGFIGEIAAQQLYISNINVGDGGFNYCDSGTLGNSRSFIQSLSGNVWTDSSLIEFERPRSEYPGACLSLCATVSCVSNVAPFGIDELTFEIFKFSSGSNPLDPASTPPVKTISRYNIATCNNTSYPTPQVIGTYCSAWDGSYNLNGTFGKTNGQFGFRAKVRTNQVSATAGNISIEQTAAFPGQNQIPIQVNVTNIHTVRSSPTVVGRITGVAAQPYNILYRLSKDAAVNINIYESGSSPSLVRSIISSAPRVGEGTPDGTLTNGDFWDGRNNSGDLVPPGTYQAQLDATSNDIWATADLAYPTTIQIAIDPLQITDVAVRPLGASATDVATISYLLTEAATVYVDIYPLGTTFDSLNASPPLIGGANRCDGDPDDLCLKEIAELKDRRVSVSTTWNGHDKNGDPVCDGDYIYAIYGGLPSNAGPGGIIYTTSTLVGTVPVARGVVVPFITPSSTVIGSSPTVAGLDPFSFRYTLSRDATVSLNIKMMDGSTTVRNVVDNENRLANFSNVETWNGKDNAGLYVSSGAYLAELITTNPFQCSGQRTSTTTAVIPVRMFRTVDVVSGPLLGGATDMASISYKLSQTMQVNLNIYSTAAVVNPATWPPGVTGSLVYAVEGIRPGRSITTEYWDGRNSSGLLVPDGRYPFTLIAYTTGPAQIIYSTDKTYGYVDVSRGQILFTEFDTIPSIPAMYNSSDTVSLPPYRINYTVTRPAKVNVQILNNDETVRANVVSNQTRIAETTHTDFWDGKGNDGNFVPNGVYNVRVVAQDIDSQLDLRTTVQMTINVEPMRIYDVAIVPLTIESVAGISYQVSEPMKVVTKIYMPGTAVPAGWGDPASGLVKQIIGLRPARTLITESWNGSGFDLTALPSGNYVFKIYGSTDVNAIDDADGSVRAGAILSNDIITANIPVSNPVAPLIAAVSDVGPLGFTANWSRNGNPIGTLFRLEMASAPDFSGTIVSSQTISASVVFADLSPSTTYYLRVRTINVGGAATAAINLGPAITAPPPLIVPVGSVMGVSSITWTWGSLSGASGYRVYPATAPSSLLTSTATSPYIQTGLSPNTTYSIVVAGVNGTGVWPVSPAAVGVVTLANVPSGTAIAAINITSVTISVGKEGNPINTFTEVERSIDNTSFIPVFAETSSMCTASDLLSYTTYYFRARNKNFAGIPTEYENAIQVFTKDAIAAPPGSLSAIGILGNRILLSWEPSPFAWVTGYRLYSDAGTGTIDYTSPLVVLSSSVTSYTTNVLVSSAAYRFGLRAVNRNGVEDWNVSSVTSDAFLTNLASPRAAIKAPQSGKRIKGNKVTVVAEITSGKESDVRQVLFQYKPASSPTWINIPSANINGANPDTETPYFIHWDVDAMGIVSATPYELRALATDIYNTEDTVPPSITVIIDPVDYDINETASGSGELQKEQKINNAVSNTVQSADDTTALVTKIVIPPGSLNLSIVAVTVINNPVSKPPPPEGSQDLGLSVKVNLSNSQTQLSGGNSATLSLGYTDNDGDGIVDGTSVRIDQLKLYSASTLTDPWVLMPSRIDTTKKTISGETSHFSFFAVFAGPSAALDTVRAYPVPFVPNDDKADNGVSYSASNLNSGIIFDNLPSIVKIKIFTMSGQLVADLDTTNSLGKLQWDVKNNEGKDAASGGYIAVISSPGNKTIAKKLLVVR